MNHCALMPNCLSCPAAPIPEGSYQEKKKKTDQLKTLPELGLSVFFPLILNMGKNMVLVVGF